MRTALLIVATICILGYLGMLLLHAITRGRAGGAVRRAQRSAGASFGQLNSVTGRVRPPSPWRSSTLWFLLVCGLGVLWAIWWRH